MSHGPPRPPFNPPSYQSATASSRARALRPTASDLFDKQAPLPSAKRTSRRVPATADGPPVPIRCPACPTYDGTDIWDHCRNINVHPGLPFVQSDFAGFETHVQVCGDCGAVLRTTNGAMSQHRRACKGRTKEMLERLAGMTLMVHKGRRKTFRLPALPVAQPVSPPAATSTPLRRFASAPSAASTPSVPAHPTPPQLVLSRDEPRSSPSYNGSPTPASLPGSPSPPSLPAPLPRDPTPVPVGTPEPAAQDTPVLGPSPHGEHDTSAIADLTTRTAAQSAPTRGMQDLLPLPGSVKHLHPTLVNPFVATANRLAASYNDNPCEETLFDVLSLVKVGLVPEMRNGHKTVVERLERFPAVSWPSMKERSLRMGAKKSKVARAKELVEAGLVGKAVRTLTSDAAVASLDQSTIDSLKSKHPQGSPNPFPPIRRDEATAATTPDEIDITSLIRSFKPDTAPGPSGWTVKLISLASTGQAFRTFLTTLTAGVAHGIAPGRDMLCTSRLTPLLKPDGGIRPIAVGEMFYRLSMKAIFKSNFQTEFLSPNQFGIGSKGGVETIIHAVQMMVDRHPAFRRFRHLTSLDASNAFNALSRRKLANCIKKYAPSLLRSAEWSYGKPSPLLLYGGGEVVEIPSEDGVRQGDPLGPLFFSIGIREAVDELQAILGDRYLVLAYLDDIFILGEDDQGLAIATEYFAREDSPLSLNVRKCKQVSVEEIVERGIELLGSCVGSTAVRDRFLSDKITEIESEVEALGPFPKQHALLMLRQSIQQKLRHLQRTLLSPDLAGCWDRLDRVLWGGLDTIRGKRPLPEHEQRDRCLISLPPNLGGLGLASHAEVAPLAYRAASSLAIGSLLAIVPELDESTEPVSQRELCREASITKQKELMATLTLHERITVVESASQIGRRWLTAIPSAPRFTVPCPAVQTALHYRTLTPGYPGRCKRCMEDNTLGHDENCQGRKRLTKSRHEGVKHRMASALRAIPGAEVVVEPYMENRLDRLNDIKITLDTSSTRTALQEEYDLKIISLSAPTHLGSLTANGKTREEKAEAARRVKDGEWVEDTETRVAKVLSQQARRKVTNLPAEERERVEGTGIFTPLVLSSGGLQEGETMEKIRDWKRWNMPPGTYSWLLTSIAVSLVNARAKTFLV
nr:uncharacterized protein CI109_005596 [Kwoniella shandongensis]KAA5526001.1 hypothetical protein CI109_005596 [Kwoniella shandongensis]